GAALEYGVDRAAVVRAVRGFRPLAHRLELVAEAAGVRYIDDSKATNPHATLAAVKGLGDVVLIAGGRSKGIDLKVLAATVPPVRSVIVLGEAADELGRVFGPLVPVHRADSMDRAVQVAAAQAVDGGSVLLSPGCASLDMYESYAQRGEAFAAAVRMMLRSEHAEDSVDGDAGRSRPDRKTDAGRSRPDRGTDA
ncbi:MAG: glutamate ligase domain-containing protein, partial [Actinomycetota bacterium]